MWKYLFPKDAKANAKTKQRLAIAYAIIAWNLAGFTIYSFISEKTPSDLEKRRIAYASLADAKTVHVYRYQGLESVGNFILHPSSDQAENNTPNEEMLDEFQNKEY